MVSFDELKRTLTSRLFENASDRHAGAQLTGREIANMLHDLTGYAVAGQVRNELLQNGLLRQIRAISDDDEGEYEITPNLIREIESSQALISSKAGETTFSEFKKCLIVALYEKSNVGGLNLYPLKDLADEKGMFYREGWIIEVLTFLDEHGYALIVKSMGGDGTAAAKLKASGLEYAEELISETESGGEEPDTAPGFVPASDRYVEIDNNSPTFKNAETTVESATQAIRGLNEPTNYDSEQVVQELTLGQQLFKSAKVRVAAVAAMILAPLYTVYQDTAAEVLRPIVGAAINAVEIWLNL